MFLKQGRSESFKTINELLGMLKIPKKKIPSKLKKQILMVQKRKNVLKKKGKLKKQIHHPGKGKKGAHNKRCIKLFYIIFISVVIRRVTRSEIVQNALRTRRIEQSLLLQVFM